jgi:hypothetical protein
MEAATLAVIAVAITVLVYGAVALIVKADDAGLAMATHGRLGLTRAVGRAVVKGMPGFLKGLTLVGTAAMLWVGGSIILHGLEVMGTGWPADAIHAVAAAVAHVFPEGLHGGAEWTITALIDGALGLGLGLLLIPVVARVIEPAVGLFQRGDAG